MRQLRKRASSERVWQAFGNFDRLALVLVGMGCAGIFYLLSKWMGWPVYLKSEASILAGSAPITGIAVTAIGLIFCVGIASLAVGYLRYEAGLFTACIGLAVLASRGGTVGALIRTSGQPRVYFTMMIEMIMLMGMIGLAWSLLEALKRSGWLMPESATGRVKQESHNWAVSISATFAQAIVTAALLLLIARDDNKKQVLCAILISSLIGSVLAHQIFPARPSLFYWIGPMLVGIGGYAWALKSPGRWDIGIPANALASVCPMDFASLGTAGAIFGYWVSRQWHEAEAFKLNDDLLE